MVTLYNTFDPTLYQLYIPGPPGGVHHGWMSSPSSGSFLSGTPNSNSEAATEMTLGHRNVISYLRPDNDPDDDNVEHTKVRRERERQRPTFEAYSVHLTSASAVQISSLFIDCAYIWSIARFC